MNDPILIQIDDLVREATAEEVEQILAARTQPLTIEEVRSES